MIRSYVYAIGEVAGIAMFGVSIGTLFRVPKLSAFMFMTIGVGAFALCTCLKRIDHAE